MLDGGLRPGTLTVVGGATGMTTVDYQTVDDEAVAPGDYTDTMLQTLNFADGQTSATFDVLIQDDDLLLPALDRAVEQDHRSLVPECHRT